MMNASKGFLIEFVYRNLLLSPDQGEEIGDDQV